MPRARPRGAAVAILGEGRPGGEGNYGGFVRSEGEEAGWWRANARVRDVVPCVWWSGDPFAGGKGGKNLGSYGDCSLAEVAVEPAGGLRVSGLGPELAAGWHGDEALRPTVAMLCVLNLCRSMHRMTGKGKRMHTEWRVL